MCVVQRGQGEDDEKCGRVNECKERREEGAGMDVRGERYAGGCACHKMSLAMRELPKGTYALRCEHLAVGFRIRKAQV